MTNTSFRKKALLSSVAMLLVALVALGSATFAWFLQNPSADAKGLTLKTETAAGLLVLSKSESDLKDDLTTAAVTNLIDFSHSTILNCVPYDSEAADTTSYLTTDTKHGKASTDAKVLKPISLTSAGTFKAVDAAASDSYEGTGSIRSAAGTDYYSEVIYTKATGGSSTTLSTVSVKLVPNADAGDMKLAVRVAVLNGTTVLGVWSLDGVANKRILNTASTYGSAALEDYTITQSETPVDVSSQSISVAANGSTSLTLVAYLDGEDDKCFSEGVDATTLFDSIELYLTVPTAS